MKNHHQALFLIFFSFIVLSSHSEAKTIENLDPEYCISELQQQFPMLWEEQWEETITGFRIRGASFDLHTLHILQHWKGQFSFSNYFLFCFNYFTDANENSQFSYQELELKFKLRNRNFISLFGYPFYDKKESDIGVRFSYEDTPLDYIRLSTLLENAPNNYTFKGRDQDSMRIYSHIPILFSLDISLIKKQRQKLIISYNIEKPYRANYEDQNGEVLNRTEGQKSNIFIKHRYLLPDSAVLSWNIGFEYNKEDYFSSKNVFDSTIQYVRLRTGMYAYKRISSSFSLTMRYDSDLEEQSQLSSAKRKAILIGIERHFGGHSSIGLNYCNGYTRKIFEDKTRRDNRLILTADHKFKNKARVGMNLGIEIDSRDVANTWFRRYDKLFLFLQYPNR